MLDPLTLYVFYYHSKFLTLREKQAYDYLCVLMKTRKRGNESAGLSAYLDHRRAKSIPKDPEALRLAADGFEALLTRAVERIMREHRDEITFNNCPRCGKTARTPTANQCRYCYYDWHTCASK